MSSAPTVIGCGHSNGGPREFLADYHNGGDEPRDRRVPPLQPQDGERSGVRILRRRLRGAGISSLGGMTDNHCQSCGAAEGQLHHGTWCWVGVDWAVDASKPEQFTM